MCYPEFRQSAGTPDALQIPRRTGTHQNDIWRRFHNRAIPFPRPNRTGFFLSKKHIPPTKKRNWSSWRIEGKGRPHTNQREAQIIAGLFIYPCPEITGAINLFLGGRGAPNEIQGCSASAEPLIQKAQALLGQPGGHGNQTRCNERGFGQFCTSSTEGTRSKQGTRLADKPREPGKAALNESSTGRRLGASRNGGGFECVACGIRDC